MQSTLGPNASWRSVYPFASHELQLPGGKYHYLDEGAGDPVLLVHGNPTWSFHWREMIMAWRDRRRLIAPDHLGCGLSDKPADWHYTLAAHRDNLLALIEKLDLRRVTLIAQDWGGAIGLGAALAARKRFSRIVLLNTAAFPPWFIPWRIRACRLPVLGKLGVRGLNMFARAAQRMTLVHREKLTAKIRDGYLAPYDSWANRVAIMRFVEDIPLDGCHPTWHTLNDIATGLPSLAHLPIQMIWGMQDWCFTPACLEKFRQFFPNAEIERLAEAGHWVLEDDTPRVLELIDSFLNRHPLEQG
jgi:pimeloyl-ACP methyl ester carboxylesterase